MSGEEMREQKIRLRVELEEAETHLNALRVSAQIHGEILIALGVKLREQPETVYRDGLSALHGTKLETLSLLDDQTIKSLDLSGILKRPDEIRKEMDHVKTLQNRLALLK